MSVLVIELKKGNLLCDIIVYSDEIYLALFVADRKTGICACKILLDLKYQCFCEMCD